MKTRLAILAIAATIAVASVAVAYAINAAYQRGVTKTVQEFMEADQEGAKNVTETANEILRAIDPNANAVGLLCETDGIRDAECND